MKNEEMGVVEESVNFPAGYSMKSMAEKLSEKLHTEILMRGIHPGHCAVLFDGDAALEIFPPQDGGLFTFVELVNDNLRARVRARADIGMLQISQSMEETLLYGRSARDTPAFADTPLLCEIALKAFSGAEDREATAAFWMEEGHAKVNPQRIE